MRRLTAYVAILCLSLSRGVSSEEKSETHSKEFQFENKEVLFSTVPFRKNEMVFAVNEGDEDDEKWKIYLETNNLNESKVKSCDVELKNSFHVALYNVGNSKAVLVERANSRTIMLHSADLKNCKIHTAKIDVTNSNVLKIVIVPHENDYDVIFRNKKICKDFLCKATFDYEGKSVKAPSGFLKSDKDLVMQQVEHNGNTYFAILSYKSTIEVVLVQDKDKQPNELFSGKLDVKVGLSAKENKFGYCLSKDQKKIECKHLNEDGVDESKGINFEVTLDKEDVQSVDTYNLKKGLLVLWTSDPSETSNHRTVSIAHLNEMGKEVKSMDLNLKCSDSDILFPKIVQNSNGEYCVTSMCIDSSTYNKFSRNTRCFLNSELF